MQWTNMAQGASSTMRFPTPLKCAAMFEAPLYACPTHYAKESDARNRTSLIANDSVDASVSTSTKPIRSSFTL